MKSRFISNNRVSWSALIGSVISYRSFWGGFLVQVPQAQRVAAVMLAAVMLPLTIPQRTRCQSTVKLSLGRKGRPPELSYPNSTDLQSSKQGQDKQKLDKQKQDKHDKYAQDKQKQDKHASHDRHRWHRSLAGYWEPGDWGTGDWDAGDWGAGDWESVVDQPTGGPTRADGGEEAAINLLSLLDKGKLVKGQLVLNIPSPPAQRLVFPYQPPKEYDFEMTFTRSNETGVARTLSSACPFWISPTRGSCGGRRDSQTGLGYFAAHKTLFATWLPQSHDRVRKLTVVFQLREEGVTCAS